MTDLSTLTDLDPNALYIASFISEEAIKQQLDAVYDQMRAQMGKNAPPSLAERLVTWLDDAFKRHLHIDHLRETRARLLTMFFSADELVELAAFYRSPIGRKNAAVEPKMGVEMMEQMMRTQMALLKEFQVWFEKVLQPDINKGIYD